MGKKVNLINKRFSRLLVIKDTNKRNKNGNVIWLCKCDCGTIKEIIGSSLINESTKSCGCLNKEITSKIQKQKMKGKLNPQWKGGYDKRNIPLYDTYASQIDWCEEVRRSSDDENILQVKCTYCGKWYTPELKTVWNRINALKGKQIGEHNFYCSTECKELCPIYGKINYQVDHSHLDNIQRPYQMEWSIMVLKKANFKCEICESKKNLVAHHIKPVKTHPHLQADVDNGICLCKKCHDKHGHKDECSTGNLAKLVCS